jgi:hypothetical protein
LQSFECKIFTNVELVKLKYDLEFLIETSSWVWYVRKEVFLNISAEKL